MNTDALSFSGPQTGSSLYYALLYTTPEERQAVSVVLAFIDEMKSIVKNASDVGVAKAKLNWWLTEINQIYKGYPQHPLSTALLSVIKTYKLPINEFQHIVQSTLIEIDAQFSTPQEKDRYFRYGYGAKLYLISCITSHVQPPDVFITHLGAMLQTIHEIRFVGKNEKRTQHFFGSYDSTQMITILKSYRELAKVHFKEALASLTAQESLQQSSLIILANINNALLDEINRSNFEVLHQKISLTPLKKLWITWRTKAALTKRFKQNKKQ